MGSVSSAVRTSVRTSVKVSPEATGRSSGSSANAKLRLSGSDAQPTSEEVFKAAAAQGAEADNELLWMVEQMFSYVPEGYDIGRGVDNSICFINLKTGEKSVVHPLEHIFQEALKLYRRALDEGSMASVEAEMQKWKSEQEKPRAKESKWKVLKMFQGGGSKTEDADMKAAAERKLRIHLGEIMLSRLDASFKNTECSNNAEDPASALPSSPTSPAPPSPAASSPKSRSSPKGARDASESPSHRHDEAPASDQEIEEAPRAEEKAPALPEGWKAVWSEEENDWYYWHVPTNTVQWEPPEEAADATAVEEEKVEEAPAMHEAAEAVEEHVEEEEPEPVVEATAASSRTGSKASIQVDGLDSDDEEESEEEEEESDEDLMGVLHVMNRKASSSARGEEEPGEDGAVDSADGDSVGEEPDDVVGIADGDTVEEDQDDPVGITDGNSSGHKEKKPSRPSSNVSSPQNRSNKSSPSGKKPSRPSSNVSSPQNRSNKSSPSGKKPSRPSSNVSSPQNRSNKSSPSGKRSNKKGSSTGIADGDTVGEEQDDVVGITDGDTVDEDQDDLVGITDADISGHDNEPSRPSSNVSSPQNRSNKSSPSGKKSKKKGSQSRSSNDSPSRSGKKSPKKKNKSEKEHAAAIKIQAALRGKLARLSMAQVRLLNSDFETPRQARTADLASDLLDTERATGSPTRAGSSRSNKFSSRRGQQPYPAEIQEQPELPVLPPEPSPWRELLELRGGPQARSAVRACEYYDSVRQQRRATAKELQQGNQMQPVMKAADFFDSFMREGGDGQPTGPRSGDSPARKTRSPSPQRSSPQRRSPSRLRNKDLDRSLRDAGLDASWLQAVQALEAISPSTLPGPRAAASPELGRKMPTRGRRRHMAKSPAQVAADEALISAYTAPVGGQPKGLRKSASDGRLRQKRSEWK